MSFESRVSEQENDIKFGIQRLIISEILRKNYSVPIKNDLNLPADPRFSSPSPRAIFDGLRTRQDIV